MTKRLFALFVCWVACAWAMAGDQYAKPTNGYYVGSTPFSSLDSACAQMVANLNKNNGGSGYSLTSMSTSANTCTIKGPYGTDVYSVTVKTYCTDSTYTLEGATTATQSYAFGGYVCHKVVADPPPQCQDSNTYSRKFYYTTTPTVSPNHYGICNIKPSEMVGCNKDSVGTYCVYKFTMDGTQFTGTAGVQNGGEAGDTPPSPDPNPKVNSPIIPFPKPPAACSNCVPCPAGTIQLGVDSTGVPLCAGSGTGAATPSTPPPVVTQPATSTTDSSGNVTTIQKTVQANADGSTTTTTKTTIVMANGATQVSVTQDTTKTPSGQDGKTDSLNPDTGKDFCQKNPGLTFCKNSSVSGTCGSITCNGDAIQCATLQAAAKMQCKQDADDADLKATAGYALGDSIIKGTDPQAGNLPSASKPDVVQLGSIDSSGWMGDGSYFKDKVISLPGGQTFTIPLSQGSDIMLGLRFITMALAGLASFKIIRGTFSSTGV